MNHPALADLDRPFPGVPACDRYLPIGPIEDSRLRIRRMIDRGEALAIVMGPPGTGKSLLGQKLMLDYQSTHRGVMLGQIRLGSRAGMIRQVLAQLERPIRGADEDSLHLELIESLTTRAGGFRPLLLVVDEAQTLTSDLLEEVRMLTNLSRDGRSLVQVVLLGGPALEETLADPQLESFVQRISARCYLHPLTEAESARYVRDSLAPFGWEATDESIRATHSACAGVPRLINQLMSRAVDLVCQKEMTLVDDRSIQLAWSELQQLPSPVLEPELRRPHNAAIEFGELTDPADIVAEPSEQVTVTVEPPPLQAVAVPAAGSDRQLESVLGFSSIDCLTPTDDALFGNDFDSEWTLDLHSPERSVGEIDTLGGTRDMVDECRLHDEVRQLSQTAVAALRGELPPEELEMVAVEAADDRDLLVIEEDVITRVEEPHAGFVASGGLRKPPREVDQRYQDLFSRLRRQR